MSQKGEAVALWGPNGAGKTTAIRCILGLQPYRGTILVGGHDVRREGKKARAAVGYVPQELAFQENVPVWETLAFYARLRRSTAPEVDRRLEELGIAQAKEKRVGELSGGMKQRLALATALLADPPILVLDEPTSNLDPAGRFAFLRTLTELRRGGKTVLFSSHRIEEVKALADRVIVLERGRVRFEATGAGLADRLGLRSLEPADRSAAPGRRRREILRSAQRAHHHAQGAARRAPQPLVRALCACLRGSRRRTLLPLARRRRSGRVRRVRAHGRRASSTW